MEIGDVLCFKVRQNLLDPKRLALKRAMDLFLSVVGGIAIFPVLVLIALAIKLESRGPVFLGESHRERRADHPYSKVPHDGA